DAASARRGGLTAKAPAGQCYQAASPLALAAVAARRNDRVPLPVRDKQAELYLREALALLARAGQAGHFRTAKSRQLLDSDADLAVLRQRDDFKAWRKKVEVKD